MDACKIDFRSSNTHIRSNFSAYYQPHPECLCGYNCLSIRRWSDGNGKGRRSWATS